MSHNREYILKLAHDNRVKFIRLWFVDILGFLKSFAITIEELEDALIEGVRFDGSTLEAEAREDEQEMIALPDPATFRILPWRPREDSVARMFCDIYTMKMEPYQGDSRQILKQELKKAASEGYIYYTGPEIEFFFFRNPDYPDLLDRGGYYDLTPLDLASDLRRQVVLALEDMEIDVLSSHHEASHSQHEIDLRHADALTTADNIMTFRLTAKEIGQLNNSYASFMPKPMDEQNGSGMHIHQSLYSDDTNIFYDGKSEHFLSETARRFIAGQLRHSREFFAVTNPWINSYKRLRHGFESPTGATWSPTSPSAMIRVPLNRSDKPGSMRVEMRSPDSSCNPYLAFAVLLASGLQGIREKYDIPEPRSGSLDGPLYDLGTEENSLPRHLLDAVRFFHSSDLMKKTLGELVHSRFMKNKLMELRRYNARITNFEIEEYFSRL